MFVWVLPNWAEASERKAFYPWLMAFEKQKEERRKGLKWHGKTESKKKIECYTIS